MTGERKKAVNETFSEIYDAYRDDIFQFCMARLGCDIENSEDCTQESFIVLYNRISKGEEIRNPRAFLYKTAYNITMKAIEKRNRKAAYESSLDDDNRNIQLKSDFNKIGRAHV